MPSNSKLLVWQRGSDSTVTGHGHKVSIWLSVSYPCCSFWIDWDHFWTQHYHQNNVWNCFWKDTHTQTPKTWRNVMYIMHSMRKLNYSVSVNNKIETLCSHAVYICLATNTRTSFICNHLSYSGSQGVCNQSQLTLVGQQQPGQVTRLSHGWHIATDTINLNLNLNLNLTYMSLDCGRKPEKTHAYMRRTRKLHTKGPARKPFGVRPH